MTSTTPPFRLDGAPASGANTTPTVSGEAGSKNTVILREAEGEVAESTRQTAPARSKQLNTGFCDSGRQAPSAQNDGLEYDTRQNDGFGKSMGSDSIDARNARLPASGLRSRQRGVTLVELVISIVVVAIAVAGVVGVLSLTIAHSADPVIEQQAVSVAQAYIEEIASQPYTDPDGASGETNRADFDDVSDYDGLHDTGAHDQNGDLIPALKQYNVAVSVAPVTLNGASAKLVTVTVQHAGVTPIVLSTYRTPIGS